jgi:hypothetical protein
MLPGLRFLLAAIVLTMSVLVFGLGAAALLRTAHEEFASNPSWRAAPETVFAQQSEAARPVLAMLRVDPPVSDQKMSEAVAVAPAPADPVANPAAPSEQTAMISTPAESEAGAVLKPDDASPSQPAKPDSATLENPAQNEAARSEPNAAASLDASVPVAQPKIATIEQALSAANETAPAASETARAGSEPADAPASVEAGITSTKTAALGGASVIAETPSEKAAGAKLPGSAVKKRAARPRKIVRRVARPAPQQFINPFAPPFVQPFAQPTAATRAQSTAAER